MDRFTEWFVVVRIVSEHHPGMSNLVQAVREVFGPEAFDIINLAAKADAAANGILRVSAIEQKRFSDLRPGHEDTARNIAISAFDVALFSKRYEALYEGLETIVRIFGKRDEFSAALKRLNGRNPQ